MASSLPLDESHVVDDTGHVLHHDDLAHYVNLADLEQYSVKAYGALGNNSADDTTAVQAAIAAAGAVGGGVVFFPTGIYKISGALTLLAGVSLAGAGALNSVIRQTSTTANGVSLGNIANARTQIAHLGFTGPGSGTGNGIHLDRSTSGSNQINVTVRDVVIKTFGGHGLYTQGGVIQLFEAILAQDCGSDGFHVDNSSLSNAGTTSTTFLNCYANNPARYGFMWDGDTIGNYSSFINCGADTTQIGYYLKNAYYVSIENCGAEVHSVAGVKVEASHGINIKGTFSTAASAGPGFWLTSNSRYVTIANCRTSSNGAGATYNCQVDSGSHATLINNEWSSSKPSLYTGIVNMIQDTSDDGSGLKMGVGITDATGPLHALSSATLATTDTAIGAYVRGDTVGRLQIRGDGRILWGSGTGAADTVLYRSSAGLLAVDSASKFFAPAVNVGQTSSAAALYVEYLDSATAATGIIARETAGTQNSLPIIQALGGTSSKRALDVRVTGDTAEPRWAVRSDGQHTWGDGSVRDTNLYRLGADQLATDDDFILAALGKGFRIKAGTNGRLGEATLVGGTVTVANTTVTTTTYVFLSRHASGGTAGHLSAPTRTAGTSFVISSSSATDTSTVFWLLIEASP